MTPIQPLSTNTPSEPPSKPVLWLAVNHRDNVMVAFRDRTWFSAVLQARKHFNCESHELEVIMGTEHSVMYAGNRWVPDLSVKGTPAMYPKVQEESHAVSAPSTAEEIMQSDNRVIRENFVKSQKRKNPKYPKNKKV